MPAYSSVSTFFNGIATAYFAIYASHLLAIKKPTRLQRLLGWIYVYWTLANLKDIVYSLPGMYTDTVLDTIIAVDGWSAITFACLLFELTMPGWVTARRVAWLSVPFAVMSAFYVLAPQSLALPCYTAFLVFFGVTILWIGWSRKNVYIQYIHDNYSNIDEIDISWIGKVYAIGFLSMLLWLVASLVRLHVADALYYASSLVLWQMTLRHSRNLRQVEIRYGGAQASVEEPAPLGASAPRLADMLRRDFEDKELYLNPNLLLGDLAALLGTNRTYLSYYLGSAMGTTFYDYVNSLRIKKSVSLMELHPEYTLEYVAEASGFKSLSTFRRAFRKHAGVTPGRFRIAGDATSRQRLAINGSPETTPPDVDSPGWA